MGADGSGNSGNVPPPFLTKTYEMVDDPSTDHVVSWSDNCCSFVVWNVADFTRDLLPQYFKHNNFSSFVRQLNTYGFHKIDPERQEFANEGFSKGNKENLRNIHRRKPSTPHNQSSQLQKEHNLIGCNDPAHAGLEEEVERLHKEKGLLLAELLKVRQQQESTEMEMESLGERLQALEERQQQIMACFVRVLGSPAAGSFAKRIGIQQIESSMLLTFNKRKRLPDKEVVMGTGESWEDDEVAGKQPTRYHFSDAGDVVSGAHTVKTELDEPSYQRVLRQFASSTVNHSNETSPMSRTSGVTLWERPPEANDSAGNLLPATHSGAADCSDYAPCQSTAREEHNRAVSLSTMLDDQSRSLGHPKEREIIKVNNEVSGSNDVFWESLLTENPRLSDMDADESEDARRNERWFL